MHGNVKAWKLRVLNTALSQTVKMSSAVLKESHPIWTTNEEA